MLSDFAFAVIGAGISGLTISRLIAEQLGKKVLIVEKRGHIGGNCHDCRGADGILVHKYGPHIFHTDDKQVYDFLSRFTSWSNYQHRVLSFVDGIFVPFPICGKTINMLLNLSLSTREIQTYLDSVRDRDRVIRNSEDVVLRDAGQLLYEKFFKNYTKKQWDAYPDELSPQVISRIPIRTNDDDRYFTDKYQGMPTSGYSSMFGKMADHPNISILLGADYREHGLQAADKPAGLAVICTAPIDEYFGHSLGRLKYRSLDIRFESHNQESYQPAAVVNYPNDYDFTRITEYKKLTGEASEATAISLEYPTWDGDPFYPVLDSTQQGKYAAYCEKAAKLENVFFLGRLGEYRYYNMDAAVAAAFSLFERLKQLNATQLAKLVEQKP